MGIARRGILKELELSYFEKKMGQHVNEVMTVAAKNFKNFLMLRFLIIRQNVNMATNTILNSGLTPRTVPGYFNSRAVRFSKTSIVSVKWPYRTPNGPTGRDSPAKCKDLPQ